jgi:DNA-3-methyladenine glycosylase
MRKFVPLPRGFYEASAREVAPRLLGHWLIRRTASGFCGGPIVETEAYLRDDPACHAAPGLTARNSVMFGPPGHAYVYFIYGVHYCVNAVCCPPGTGEAVLVRAIEGTVGVDILKQNRRASSVSHLTSGPGKLCEAMKIDRALNGSDLCGAESELLIARNSSLKEFLEQRGPVIATRRIGLTKAADLPLRFCLRNSAWVSRKLPEPRTE